LVWDPSGDELRIYSLDGKSFIIGILQDGSLTLVEDCSSLVYKEVLDEIAGDDSEDGEEEETEASKLQPLSNTGKQIRFYGADTSANGVTDVLLYTYV
jgi:hypothetical protein